MNRSAPCLLLDLDGTLVDSQPGILASCRAALRSLGHEPGPSMDLASVIGPPMDDVMRYLLAPYGDDRIAEGVAAYRADYGDKGLLMTELYPGIADALHSIHETGRARLFLATSKRRTFAERILGNLGLSDCFEGIYGSVPGGAIDHKPELIAHILAENDLPADRCVMVGDRRYDISGAHANDVRAIGVLWGYGSLEELETAGADLLIARADELADAAIGLLPRS
jgi:phosphoglycolate phosphatase